ncbi:MAG: DUF881 domain-containing protein [Peptococcaceae bacterium]|nr:DUF881 domain-containing protein [Peptococcaceae bacterium]
MNKSMYLSIGVITMILGVMLAVQFRTNRFIEQSVPADRAQELQVEYSKLEKDIRKFDREIEDLTYKLEQAKKGQMQAREAIQDELKKARINAGLVTVSGPGIEVVMDNPPSQSRRNSIFIIRDVDLLRVVNELWGAGAEAVSINGQRMISTSEIRQAGSFININLERIEPPFQILAIGSPEKLKSALEISGGLADYFKDLGIVVKIQSHSSLTVPAYSKSLQFNYAKAVWKG